MRFYISKCNDQLNGKPYFPERINPNLCLSPYYPVKIDMSTNPKIMIDSGAFQDVGKNSRLTYEEALDRQINVEKKLLDGEIAEAIVSYDRLVDEQLDDDKKQIKKRVSHKVGKKFVEETIEAARFLAEKRDDLEGRKLILSCQGTSIAQYVHCVKEILTFAEKDDIIGLGGFCIVSRSIEYEQQYYKILRKAIPLIKKAGLSRIHIFGLGMFRALVQTDIYTRMHGIEASYDTSSPAINGAFGKIFQPTNPGLSKTFTKSHKKRGYHPADLAIFNVKVMTYFWEEHEQIPLPKRFVPKYESSIQEKKSRT